MKGPTQPALTSQTSLIHGATMEPPVYRPQQTEDVVRGHWDCYGFPMTEMVEKGCWAYSNLPD